MDLHSDSISTDAKDEGKKVVCLQYEGIAPKNIVRLFGTDSKRKEEGKAVVKDRKIAKPVFPPPLDGFSMRERIIVNEVHTLERELEQESGT